MKLNLGYSISLPLNYNIDIHEYSIENKELIMTLMPRTKIALERFDIDYSGIKTIEPVGFFQCLALQKRASIIFTVSGLTTSAVCL